MANLDGKFPLEDGAEPVHDRGIDKKYETK
jgi:hypothetical protein